MVPPVPCGCTGGVGGYSFFRISGLVSLSGLRRMSGPSSSRYLAAPVMRLRVPSAMSSLPVAHVPLPGFALAGDERGPGPVPGFHDLEDEDAVGGCGRG